MQNESELIGKLRYFHENTEFPVCGSPAPRNELTEEEYAPYRAAAEGKHDAYMRHGAPYAPGDLAYHLVVNHTMIAWLPYDGVPRVVERDFGHAGMNRIRNLARVHLGADPIVQQRLANKRADINHMDADGFDFVIFRYRSKAQEGSKFNDFPLEMSTREYTARVGERLRLERGLGPDEHVYVPNPTREYTRKEREAWSREAERYDKAFLERLPQEYVAWSTQMHLKRRQQRGDLGSVQLQERDWVAFDRGISGFEPAVVLYVHQPTHWRSEASVDVLTETGTETWVPLHSHSFVPARELLPKSQEMWRPVWEQLAERAEPQITEVYEPLIRRRRLTGE
ncbi:hypothetical protein AB0H73_06315 [Streptomyces olivoreticuli]